MTKQEKVSLALSREINKTQLKLLKQDWNAFYSDPVNVSKEMPLVIDMINLYLDEKSLETYKANKVAILHQMGCKKATNTDFEKCNSEIQVDNRFRSLLFA